MSHPRLSYKGVTEVAYKEAPFGQLFYSTPIPVCVWFLAKNKAVDPKRGFRHRSQQALFIEARKLGSRIDRVQREMTAADLEKITSTYHAHRSFAVGFN